MLKIKRLLWFARNLCSLELFTNDEQTHKQYKRASIGWRGFSIQQPGYQSTNRTHEMTFLLIDKQIYLWNACFYQFVKILLLEMSYLFLVGNFIRIFFHKCTSSISAVWWSFRNFSHLDTLHKERTTLHIHVICSVVWNGLNDVMWSTFVILKACCPFLDSNKEM